MPSPLKLIGGLEEYPSIYVVSFVREEIPEIVTAPVSRTEYYRAPWDNSVSNPVVPQEVLRMFQETGKDVVILEGTVWKRIEWPGSKEHMYRPYQDFTSITRATVENPDVQRYLASLESYVGKEVQTRDILPRWERYRYFRDVFLVPNLGLHVAFHEDEKAEGYRSSHFMLMKPGLLNLGRWGGPALVGIFTLGTIKYEGRVNVPSSV